MFPNKIRLLAELSYTFVSKMISDTAGSKAKPYFLGYSHFSGHGMSLKDKNRDEKDGHDESICLNNNQY